MEPEIIQGQQVTNNPQAGVSEFKVLTDLVKFPSKGFFYPDKKDSVMVELMTAIDEQILLSPQLIKSNKAFDKLLERKIKDRSIIPSELLTGDQNAILMYLRMSAYGPEYAVTVTSPFTGDAFEAVVNLTKIQEKELTIMPDKDSLLFTYITKDNKWNIKFRLLTAGEETKIQERVDFKATRNGGINEIITERLKAQIEELNGNNNKMRIMSFIDTMSPRLSREIRNYIDECTPGLDMTYEFVCPQTGERFQHFVPVTSELFYPKS